MTTPQMDWLDDQRRKRAVSSDDIVRRMELMDVPPGSYDEETLYEAAAEIERLRSALEVAADRMSMTGAPQAIIDAMRKAARSK